jgi:DNA-binding CsgD family transcriptional regulator
VQLQERFRVLEARERWLSTALDRLTMGAIFVDARARPLLMNRAAKEIVRRGDGLRSAKDGLEAARQAETIRLRQAVFDAARTSAGEGTSPGAAMRLPRPSARRPLQILVSPLPSTKHLVEALEASVVVFVSDPELAPHAVKDLLVHVHGLTPAEAELAEALLAGTTLADFAEQTGRRIYTVRKTLQHVFAKTDTSRQSELVRLLLGGLAMLQGPPADSG